MNDIIFTITQQGLNRITQHDGIQAQIAAVAFGTGNYHPTGQETTLLDETARVKTSGVKDSNTINLQAEIIDGEFNISEVGIILADGTLFALYSHPHKTIAEKLAGVTFRFSYSINLQDINSSNLTVTVNDFDSAKLARHLENLNNPHNITAEQISAAH